MRRFLRYLLFATLLVSLFLPARADETGDALDRGNQFFATGQYRLAIFHYRIGLAHVADDRAATLHFNIGACQYSLGDMNEAIREYQTAISLRHGNYPKASYGLGLALRVQRRKAEAQSALRQAIAQSGGRYAEASFALGLLLAGDGDYAAAISALRQALKAGGHIAAPIHNNIGVVMAMTGNLTAALTEFDLALKHSRGKMSEAVFNQQLCHRLINHAERQLIAEFRLHEQSLPISGQKGTN